MAKSKALVWLCLVSYHVLFVLTVAQPCPNNCFVDNESSANLLACRCPQKSGAMSACSWAGHGGMYSFPICLKTIPTDFIKRTRSIFIEHLCSSTLQQRAFSKVSHLHLLKIQRSNVSKVQRWAFMGLPLLQSLHLQDNRIIILEPDAFLGLDKLNHLYLDKNMISFLSHQAFRGLPLLDSLWLENNLLRSVPTVSLLQPRTLRYVYLENNRISVIDSKVMPLQQNQRVRLLMGKIKVQCDEWFICNQRRLYHLSFHPLLTCASPADLKGLFPSNIRKGICQTTTYRPHQMNRSTQHKEMSVTTVTTNVVSTGPQITNSSLYHETIVTEDYTEIYPTDMTASKHTTAIDIIVLLEGDPVISEDVNSFIAIAFCVPLLLVLATVSAFLVCEFCSGTEPAAHDVAPEADEEAPPNTAGNIEPYAVTYADPEELQGSEGNSATDIRPAPPCDKTPETTCTIKPYAVAYAEDEGAGIQPYAVAYDEEPGPQIQCHRETSIGDQEQDDNYKIKPTSRCQQLTAYSPNMRKTIHWQVPVRVLMERTK
uniref:LRRCT domain-containing protein n=1 Tax=Branchiostoma floridae TaxID=7739 RepID=C3Y628_BRAFL|eukprot:XP_002608415.1 hypothetical protein BRAFLDRAFT_96555 [Branchiostoma floridae]